MEKFWLPPSVGRARTTYTCHVCGEEGVDDMHVVECSKQIEGMTSPRQALGVFGAGKVDVELEEWVEKNAREINEGRKKL